MKVLDLFCCAGGASVGYHRAGLDVVGVDIEPRSTYPFEQRKADAVQFLADGMGAGFDFIHASPPCQDQCTLTLGTNAGKFTYPNFYEPVRRLMLESGIPGVIENPEARPDVVLCGEMFGLGVIRHRKFELINWTTSRPEHKPHRGRVAGYRHGEWFDGPYFAVYGNGGGKGSVAQWQRAMGIDWTDNRKEIAEAIPPAYTEWVGRRFIEFARERV